MWAECTVVECYTGGTYRERSAVEVYVRAADGLPFHPAHRRSQDQDTTGTVILLASTRALVAG